MRRSPFRRPIGTLGGGALLGAAVAAFSGIAGYGRASEPTRPPAAGEHLAREAPRSGPVTFDHRVGLRFRPELLLGGDLDGGASNVPAPLEATPLNGSAGEDTLAWASVRLRYETAIRVGIPWTVHLSFDALDDLVLGSTHVQAGGDFDRGLWEDSQAPPETGEGGSFRDSLRVRHAWGAWRALEWLDVEAGRMPDHFGLGLVRNARPVPDADFDTRIDGVRMGFSAFAFRLEGGLEFTAKGATTDRGGPGQPVDLGRMDDVRTWTLRLFREGDEAPPADGPFDVAWEEGRPWRIRWALFSSFTSQELSSSEPDLLAAGLSCPPESESPPALSPDCTPLYPRDAFFWRPGLWFRSDWRPDLGRHLRIEAEAGAILGSVGNLQRSPDLEATGKDFVGFGAAGELDWTDGARRLGLDLGFASGDDRRFLGIADGQNVTVPDDALYEDDPNVSTNRTVTSFAFHRDYRVDLLLFRQVVGGVTNAMYAKPWIGVDLLADDEARLSARLDVLYAAAARVSGSPGRGRHYGVELDGRLELRLRDGFGASVTAGWLLPMDALRDRDTGASPSDAFAVRGLLSWDL